MARSPKRKNPTTQKQLLHNILYRIEQIELTLKMRNGFVNNPASEFVDTLVI